MNKGKTLYTKAKNIIPGVSQLISKRPDALLSDVWPFYFSKAKGCEIWDLDGTKYMDASHMSVGTCLLGYADDDIDNAVREVIDKGTISTLLAAEDVDLAELLCEIHPWADMVRFARSGGEAMSVAVRIARTKAQKDVALVCGYHGWHDWYLAANLVDENALEGHLRPFLKPLGVPEALKGTVYPFRYNDTKGFLNLVEKHRNDIGLVVMEPIRNIYPEKGFLETVREVTKDLKIVLVFDEITAGWRLTEGGAHLLFNVHPDMAVFGKAISNGYPMAAIVGRRDVMEAAERTFISSTYWTERIGPAAALATLRKLREKDVPRYITGIGGEVQEAWKKLAENNKLEIDITGIAPLSRYSFKYDSAAELNRQFTRLMLRRGIISSQVFYASYAHSEHHLGRYFDMVDSTFAEIAEGLSGGNSRT